MWEHSSQGLDLVSALTILRLPFSDRIGALLPLAGHHRADRLEKGSNSIRVQIVCGTEQYVLMLISWS